MESMDKELYQDFIGVIGSWKSTVTRADGTEEVKVIENTVTANGLDALASRAVGAVTSAFAYLAIGTVTAAASLSSTEFGEVSRKTPATIASSNEYIIGIMTWAGAADSITSVALGSAAIVNHASSGQGTILNIVNGLGTTLADSDFLKLEAQVRVGSH